MCSYNGLSGSLLVYKRPESNNNNLINNNLSVHRAVGEFWAQLARKFADSPMLPLDVSTFAKAIWFDCVQKLKKDINEVKETFPEAKDAVKQVSNLLKDAQRFINTSRDFEKMVAQLSSDPQASPLRRASVNNRLVAVDRCFVNPQGIPGQPYSRHVLYSISELDSLKEAQDAEQKKEAGRRLA